MISNFGASVTNRNTAESDMEMFVWHTVSATKDGVPVTAQVLAIDPMDAIKLAHKLQDKDWSI